MDNRAIGIFDSGLGGLTAVKEMRRLLPNENIIYFGDTARIPYGSRSKETIIKYAVQDIDFLLKQDVKVVLAACGTVSSTYPPSEAEKLNVPYLGVVEPAAVAAVAATKNHKIGIIGTKATVKSGSYGIAIKKMLPEVEIFQNACPLFVPVIEAGYIEKGNEITTILVKEYLTPLKDAGVDVIIMGCTHYPIIAEMISEVMGDGVTLISSGLESAKAVKHLLEANEAETTSKAAGISKFYVSDTPDSFVEIGGVFLGASEQELYAEQITL